MTFDDDHLVADAGLVLVATLVGRLDLGSGGLGETAQRLGRFVDEMLARLERAAGRCGDPPYAPTQGSTDTPSLPARPAGVGFSVTIARRVPVRDAIGVIDDRAWQRIDYPDGLGRDQFRRAPKSPPADTISGSPPSIGGLPRPVGEAC